MPENDFRAAFLTAMREGGEARLKAFSYFETTQADRFKGEDGLQFYEDLLEVVRESRSEEAVTEFQARFSPLIDQERLGKELFTAFSDGLEQIVAEKERAVAAKQQLLSDLEKQPPADPPAQPAPQLPDSISTFFTMAQRIYGVKGRAAFEQWLAISFDALPEDDRLALLSTLMRTMFEAEKKQ